MESRKCPDCGTVLSPAAVEGMCPVCLAGLLSFDDPAPPDAPPDAPPGTPPPVEASSPAPELSRDVPVRFTPHRSSVRATPPPSAPIRLNIPGYRVTAEIARGGMGIVYRATQLDPEREVALKMLLPSQVGIRHLKDHFLVEARSIARLSHPNILPIFQLGEHEGIPFFTMKLATQGSLQQRRARYRGQWALIAEHVALLADAVGYAHQRGILHRDLKPANVLFDESNRPYVTDFGLARVAQDEVPGASGSGGGARLLGTPRYMAPEVIEGGADAATTASDLYALGLIFYELLAQRGPLEGISSEEYLRRPAGEPLPRPSRFLPGIPVDLELLCLRCLDPDRNRRLSSATLLRDELRLWISGKPVHVRPQTGWDRLRMWAREHRLLSASAVLGVVAAGVSVVVAVVALQELQRFRQEEIQSRDARQEDLVASRVGEARRLALSGRLGQGTSVLGLLRDAARVQSTPGLRTEAVRQLTRPDVGGEEGRFPFAQPIAGVAISPGLALFALADPAGNVQMWRRSTAKALWQQPGGGTRPPAILEFSREGQALAIGADARSVSIHEAASGKLQATVAGTWLGFSGADGELVSWQGGTAWITARGAPTPRARIQVPPDAAGIPATPWLGEHRGRAGLVVPRGDRLELLSEDGTRIQQVPMTGEPPTAVLWQDDWLVVGDASGILRAWSLPDPTPRVLAGHVGPVRHLQLEPASRRLWSTDASGESCWWDLDSGFRIGRAPGWRPLRTSSDGRKLMVLDDNSLVERSLLREAGRRHLPMRSSQPVLSLEFAPGDQQLATVQPTMVRVWDVATTQPLAGVRCQSAESAHFSADGRRLMILESDQVRWLSSTNVQGRVEWRESQEAVRMAARRSMGARTVPGRGRVLLIDAQGNLISLDPAQGTVTRLGSGLRPDLWVSGDDRADTLVLTGPAYGVVAQAREGGRRLFVASDRWGPLSWSPDGRSLLQPGPGEHRLLELATGRVQWTAPADPGEPGSGLSAWPSDNSYVAAATRTGGIRLLQPDNGWGVFDLAVEGPIGSLAATSEGRFLAAGTLQGAVILWDVPAIQAALRTAGVAGGQPPVDAAPRP